MVNLDIATYVLIAITAFCLGSIPFAYLFGKFVLKEDLRKSGSKNTGALNILRASNRKYGPLIGFLCFILVFLLDAGKAVLAVYGAMMIGDDQFITVTIATFFAVLGHNFSPILNFKGGRGAASFLGVLLFFSPKAFLGYLIVVFTCMLLMELFATNKMNMKFFKHAVSEQIFGRLIGEVIGVFYIAFVCPIMFWPAVATTPLILFAHKDRVGNQIINIKNKTYLND